MIEELQSGIGYVRGERRLLALMVLAFAVTFLGMPLLTFLPLVARGVFQGGAGEYSRMMAFAGGGAIVGALVVAWLGRFRSMGLVALLVQATVGLTIVAFASSRVLWVSHVLLFASGVALVISTALVTSLVQLIAPNELRGRVMSIYMVAFRGGLPLGSLVSGKIADATSAPVALAIDGVLLTLVGAYFLLRRNVRIEP
jgi:predicted MFS family arabinose efflux permease